MIDPSRLDDLEQRAPWLPPIVLGPIAFAAGALITIAALVALVVIAAVYVVTPKAARDWLCRQSRSYP